MTSRPATHPFLALSGLSKYYGRTRAVYDLDLEVLEGAFVTLLGPSGCGKSTTLSLVAGLETPSAGEIWLDGVPIHALPPNERGMAMVFQNYALYPHMSVRENLSFALKLQRRGKREIADRVASVSRSLEIDGLLDRRPNQLSGGQQQRVAIGRAIIKEPSVFLFDEPFSNLDAVLRSRLRTEIKRLHQALGTTSLFVTHDQEEALALSDYVAVMEDGRIVQYGPQEEIYRAPATAYVATFVGKPSMRLMDGRVEVEDGLVSFRGTDVRMPIGPVGSFAGIPESTVDVRCGFRAEDLRLVPPDDAASASVGMVGLLEPVGADTFVEVSVGASRLTARVSPSAAPAVGELVGLRLDPSGRAHVFDRETGNRLLREVSDANPSAA